MTNQHQAVLPAGAETVEPVSVPPTPGPIAVLPDASPVFTAAVEAGGGVVAPLSAETRGLVWLSYGRSSELRDVLDANPQIEWVQLPWAGVDAFSDVLAAQSQARPALTFTSAKGAYAQPVAEHALALTLALLRVLPKRARATHWQTVPEGRSLYGLNVVIIGAGGIAHELITLLAPFRTNVTVVRRSAEAVPGAALTVQTSMLHEVLPTADVVIVAAALTAGTRHLIGAPELALMPATAA